MILLSSGVAVGAEMTGSNKYFLRLYWLFGRNPWLAGWLWLADLYEEINLTGYSDAQWLCLKLSYSVRHDVIKWRNRG